MAAAAGHLEVCLIGTLILAWAQVGWTALIRAAANGHADCARLLLDAGAVKSAADVVRASAGFGRVCGLSSARFFGCNG